MGSQSDRSSDKMPAGAVTKLILRLLICSVAIVVVTAVLNTVSLRDRPLFPLLIFLFLVSIVSSLWGFRYALFVSLLAALGFSWLRPPVGRFWLSDWRDIFALAVFLVIGITTSHLSDRARREVLNAKRAEGAARRSEEGLREVIETVPAMAWSAPPDGSNAFVNRQWAEYTGLTAEQTASSGWRSTVHPEDVSGHMEEWRQSLATGQPLDHEVRLRRTADGQYRWFLVRGMPLRDEHGEVLKWYGIATDIEDRKRAEEALRNSEERWRSVFENSAIGVALTDLNGRFLATNHVFQAMLGYTEEELRALTFLDLTHEHYVQANWSLITELVEEKRRQFQIEKKYRRKDGSSIWVSDNFSLVPGTERMPQFIMALSEDITERKGAEAKLRRSEESLLEAQRLSHIGSWKLDVASGAVIVSPEIHRIFGVDPDEDTSRLEFWLSRNHPADQKRIREFFERSTTQKTDYDADYRIVLPDGTIKHLHAAGHPVLNESGDLMEFVGTTMDVTEQVQTRAALENALQEIKQRNEALRAREHNLDLIINTIPALVWSARPDGSAEFFNQHYLDYVGLSAEEVKDWGWTVALHPDDLNGLAGAWQSIMATGKHGEAEARLRRFDGEYRWFLFRTNPLCDDSGNIVKWFGINTDIEDRKRAEEKLRRSEAYLAEAQRMTHTGSWAWNVRTDALFWSQEIFRIYDYDPEMTPTWDFLLKKVHPGDRLEVERRREMEATQKEWVDSEIEFRIVVPDGTIKHLHSIAHPVMDESGEIMEVVGTVRDVTERKHAEEERERLRQLEADLAHTNRVTMLGGLASSLAHELNQPITAAITSANACLRWLAHNPPDLERARAAATRIENDGSRAAEIIHRLRAFYKTGAPPKLELVDVNQVAGEMLALLRNEADRHLISLRTELALQLPQIMADRVQLQQVLMNLLLNGIEAITDGPGEVTIRSQSTEQGLLLISVTDTGVGLPCEKPDRLFSAFYTTKPQGTGMGLAISRSIIEAHGGRLWATVNAERGATFHFTLPAELQQ
jgi:PAS domain S-box-containing protein